VQRVLLINSDRLEPLEILAADPDVQLCAIVKPKYAHLYRDRAEVRCVSDVAQAGEVVNAAQSLAGPKPFDAVVTPLERSIISGGYVRSYLGIPGMGTEVAVGFANKSIMKKRLAAAGVPVSGFRPLRGTADLPAAGAELGWPVVLKPAIGAGTQHTYLIRDAAEAATLVHSSTAVQLDDLGVPLLLERYTAMTGELHADAVVCGGRAVAFSASRYFAPLLGDLGGFIGSYTLHDADPVHAALRTLHDRVTEVLGMVSGITHFEAYETANGLIVGEITCRPGGGGVPTVIRMKHGWDIWRALIATSSGAEPEITVSKSGEVIGWCGLPGRNGRITALSSAAELTTLPGVVRVDMVHRKGQLVAEKATSTFNSGIAYFAVPDYESAHRVHAGLRATYHIECV
jgi:hypothetical protein